MLQIKPVPTFESVFQERIAQSPTNVADKASTLIYLIEETIEYYSTCRDAAKLYPYVKQLEQIIEGIFDNVIACKFEEKEINILTEVCRRFNEDPIIHEIRDYEHAVPGPKFKRVESVSIRPKDGDDADPLESSRIHTQTPPKSKNDFSYVFDKPPGLPPTKTKTMGHENILEPKPVLREEKSIIVKLSVIEEEKLKKKEALPPKCEEVDKSEAMKKDLLGLIEKMRAELADNKIDETSECFLKIKSFATERKLQGQDLAYYEEKLKENKSLMEDVELAYTDSQVILNELADEEGYILESVKKNFAIKYKVVEGGQISLKLEGDVDVPLFNMLALINEIPGYNLWMPFCKESKELRKISKTSKVGWVKWNIPPPISNREAYVYGAGFNRLHINGSVLLVAKSIHNEDQAGLVKKLGVEIPAQTKATRLDLVYMGGAISPIARDKIRLSLVVRFDPKIKFIPLALINWVVRKTAQYLVDLLVKKATNFKGSFWEQRIKEDRPFYGWLEEEIEKHLGKQENREQPEQKK